VRQSICVTGVSRDAVLKVKTLIDGVTSEPLPLESFHVKRRSDVTDGAMLVPKIVFAATHCPGLKLIDVDKTSAAGGQLGFLYDEVCKVGGIRRTIDYFCLLLFSKFVGPTNFVGLQAYTSPHTIHILSALRRLIKLMNILSIYS